MKKEKVYLVFKVWSISLAVFSFGLFAYILIYLRVVDGARFPYILSEFVVAILLSSFVSAVLSLIYSIVQKEYKKMLIGLGILGGCFVLALDVLLLAIASFT